MGPLLHDSSPHKHFFSGKTWNAALCRTVFVVMNGKMLVYFGVHSSKIPYMFLFFLGIQASAYMAPTSRFLPS